MKKILDILKSLPEYVSSLSVAAVSLLSTMLLVSEWRRKRASEELEELKRKEDLGEIADDVKKENIDKSIDRFYDSYKQHKSDRK